MTKEIEVWCDMTEEGIPVWYWVREDGESVGPFPSEEAALFDYDMSGGKVWAS